MIPCDGRSHEMRSRFFAPALVAALALAAQAADSATFNKDVLPILQKNCQACHRPGEAAPFSLLTYESARPWAKAIKNAVVSRKMPPWQADPKFGHFLNDPRPSYRRVKPPPVPPHARGRRCVSNAQRGPI